MESGDTVQHPDMIGFTTQNSWSRVHPCSFLENQQGRRGAGAGGFSTCIHMGLPHFLLHPPHPDAT